MVQIVQKTFKSLHDNKFIEAHKTQPQAFTRQRKLPFHQLVTFLLNLVKGSLQDELDTFFQSLNHEATPEDSVSKAAFSKARRYLSHTAFTALRDNLNQQIHQQGLSPTWRGHRVYAIDGSKINLPNNPEILTHFGSQDNQHGQYPQALLSQCYNVHSGLTLDTQVAPCKANERALAAQHLTKTQANDMLIYDRGYPAFWLYARHIQQQRYFVMRMTTQSQEVNEFLKESMNDKDILVSPCHEAKKQLESLELPMTALRLRLIKVPLPKGETEVLITNLLDATYTVDDFASLYALRWSVEEDYKCLKMRLCIEGFSGKSVQAVLQDIHAKVLTKNITLFIARVANRRVQKAQKQTKWRYQVNLTQAFSNMKNRIVRLISGSRIVDVVEQLVQWFCSRTEPIRPNRCYPRKVAFGATKRFRGNYKHIR